MRVRAAFLGLLAIVLLGRGSPAAAQPDGSRAAYASAAALQEQGLYDLAADAWREILAKAPDGELAPRVRYNLGVCRFHGGSFGEAAELFEAVADPKRFPRLAEAASANLGLAKLNAARSRLANPQPDAELVEADLRAALAAFDSGIAAFPDGQQATANRFHRGETLTLLGEHEVAAQAFRDVLSADPSTDNAEAWRRQAQVGLAGAMLETGDVDGVASVVDRLVDDASAPLLAAEARLLRGEAGLRLESFAAAADDFATASLVDGFADAAYAGERAAYCHYLAGDHLAAAKAYDGVVRRFPSSPLTAGSQLAAGKCWLLADRAEEAQSRLAAAWGASKTADNAEAAYWLGRASLQLDRPDETLAVAKTVIALEPADAARFELLVADALLAAGDRQAEAADAFERFAAARPEAAAAPRALLVAAKTAQKFGDNERAERLSSTLLNRHAADPLAVDARSVFAAALLGQKSFAAAAEQFDRLAAEHTGDPRAARWLLRAAGAWREAGSDDKSLAAYTKLVEQHPSDPLVARARYDRGRLLTKAGELAASNADFQAVVEGARGSELAAYAALALATNHYAAGEREACIAVLTRLLQGGASPLRGKAYYLLATAQHAVGEHAAALESLDAAEAPPAGLSLLEARCLIGLGKGNVASAAVAGHLELHPTSEAAGELLYELAWMHRDAGRDDEALAAFQRVVNDYAETPAAAEASFRSGEIYSEASRHAEAAVAFGEAARLATQATDRDAELIEQSLHLRGWAHWKAGERDAAASAFEQQLQAAPEGVFAIEGWLMLGESRFALQRYAEALAAYERGLATDDGGRRLLPLSLLHAGQAAGQSGDWATSLQLLERARRWVKDTPLADEAAYERAWALHQLGRSDEAAPEFARLADGASGVISARAAFMRGELHFAAKEYQQAVRLFFRVAYGFGGRDAPAEYHTWQAESLFEAARCLEQLDRVDPALKLYAELVERFPESPKAELAKDRLPAAG